jgi:hypothetical protein
LKGTTVKNLDDLIARANAGLISIDADLNVGTGYDQMAPQAGLTLPEDWEDFELLSADERLALADRMIGLWQQYRARVTESRT